uniref:ITPR-interacting domain-containing protein n=1 Tax=Cacopsylla melanoneura TaxID=428564 RepID=A0A8D9F7T6_9HEMI
MSLASGDIVNGTTSISGGDARRSSGFNDSVRFSDPAVNPSGLSSGFTVPSVFVQTESSSAGGDMARSSARDGENERPAQLNLLPDMNKGSSPRNKSPVTVQEWVDSLPLETPPRVEDEPILPIVNIENDVEHDNLTLGAEATLMCQAVTGVPTCVSPSPKSVNNNVNANCEVSDAGSHDSVDSFLEARKADPETILLNLGFGGSTSNSSYSDTGRIPQRFLQPSKLDGIAIENFLKHQQLLVHSYESGLGGYRGLTGLNSRSPSEPESNRTFPLGANQILHRSEDHGKAAGLRARDFLSGSRSDTVGSRPAFS